LSIEDYSDFGNDFNSNTGYIYSSIDDRYIEISYESAIWLSTLSVIEHDYMDLLKRGWSPQQARSILPNALKTEIVVTANFREWRQILSLRTSMQAHPQMREVMIPLLYQFKKDYYPIFDDIFDKVTNEI